MAMHTMTRILSIEMSTPTASLALLENDRAVGHRRWDESRRCQDLFPALAELFRELGVTAESIGLFAVGLGPGSFTGIRMALSAVRGMALPGTVPVAGLNSAEAIAWDACAEAGCATVTVLGDARRSRLWVARYVLAEDHMEADGPLALMPEGDLPERLGDGLVVTPHWQRIGTLLRSACRPGNTLVERDCVPSAETVGRLVSLRRTRGLPLDPLRPIYLHPAVRPQPM